jgi:hypothetical protein
MNTELVIVPTFSPDGTMITLVVSGNTNAPLTREEVCEALAGFVEIWIQGDDEFMN